MSVFKSMASVDGHITTAADACVPVMDRGFLYGDSIYEVLRTYDGVPLLFDEHWARFENSASLIHMEIGYSKHEVLAAIRDVVRASRAADAGIDIYIRYVVTRGVGPIDLHPSPDLEHRLVILVKEVPAWNPVHYSKGLRLAVTSTRRNPETALDPNIKGGNYLNNVLGVIEAQKRGADDCLMLNDRALVTEASNSNVFLVSDGEVVTPSQSAANLQGITKQTIHLICDEHGIASTEREVTVADIEHADECFITSATREVMPVVAVLCEDGRELAFEPGGGEMTRRLAELYRGFVRRYTERFSSYSVY